MKRDLLLYAPDKNISMQKKKPLSIFQFKQKSVKYWWILEKISRSKFVSAV